MSFGSTPPRRSLGMGLGGPKVETYLPPKTAIDESQFLANKWCFFGIPPVCESEKIERPVLICPGQV